MKHLFTILFLFLILHGTAQPHGDGTIENPRFKSLDTAFQRALKTMHAAGFAVAVVQKNKVIYAKGFGYRNLEKKLPVTPHTSFDIGSCTKAFTATLIGQLQQQGKVDLDKPVNSYIPSIRFYNDAMNNSITLRDMMSHRTGLPRHDLSSGFFPTLSRDSLIKRIQYLEPTAPVRETFQYNNVMYATQGYIVEKLTGKSWENNVKDNILGPLSMTSTYPSYSDLYKTNQPANGYEVYHHDNIRKTIENKDDATDPAGSINSTVLDMSKWVMAWINGGKYNGKEIIPHDFYEEAISSQMVISGNLPQKIEPGLYFSNYGLAWFLSSYKGHYRVEHSGNVDGFTTSVCFFPSDSVGIIVLANQNNSLIQFTVRNLISDRLFNQKYDDWLAFYNSQIEQSYIQEQSFIKSLNSPHKAAPPSHQLTDYTGSYFNPGYGRLSVYMQHDSLYVRSTGGRGWLKHYSYDTFDFYGNNDKSGIDTTAIPFRSQFIFNAQGDVEGVSGVYQEGLKPIVFAKEQTMMAMDVKDLGKYAGNYDLNSAIVKIYTKSTGGLYVLAPNLPEYEMLPIGNDRFIVKGINGYFMQFEVDQAGLATAVTFIQPGGTYKAARKPSR